MLLQDPPEVVLAVILVAIFLLVAYPVHEFAHAWAAYMQGDSTAKLFGRLTLNPIVHFDPLGGTLTALSLLFSPILFGWAKPTPVNPSNLRDRRNGDVIVSIAGPFVEPRHGDPRGVRRSGCSIATGVLSTCRERRAGACTTSWCSTSLLAMFNLIPVPPLDGSALLYRFLTPAQAWKVRPFLAQYGFFLVLGVFLLGRRLHLQLHLRCHERPGGRLRPASSAATWSPA